MGTFALDLSAYATKAKGNLGLVAGKTTLEIFRRVIMRSPVDTGRFRGNWMPSEGEASSAVDPNTRDKTGSAALAKCASLIPTNRGGVFRLTNNLPYARKLEDGYSGQAPAGMVTLTVVEIGGILAEATK